MVRVIDWNGNAGQPFQKQQCVWNSQHLYTTQHLWTLETSRNALSGWFWIVSRAGMNSFNDVARIGGYFQRLDDHPLV
ncbi:MAG: hypothetical protein NVS4B8_06730 [Herpetosiphon sp.]